MRKPKIILTGVALLAVIGGALAFKAANYRSAANVFCPTTTITGLCTKILFQTADNGRPEVFKPCSTVGLGASTYFYTTSDCTTTTQRILTTVPVYPTVNS